MTLTPDSDDINWSAFVDGSHPAPYEASMRRKLIQQIKAFIASETGGEVLEYALVAGLIIVAAISAISTVGTKVLARWNSLKNSM